MKIKKHGRTVLALILALTFILVPPLNAAAASKGKYVSEVYLAYGKDAEEARQVLKDKGFTPVEGNVNEGGETYAMLGYKTTDDIRESVTDLAVMNMRGGYSAEDYKTLLKSQKTEIAEFLTGFMNVIKEYRLNYKNGRSKAVVVHDLLNNYVEDDTGLKMGDLLLTDTLQDRLGIAGSIGADNPEHLPDLITILMQGNTQVVSSVETLLSMAADTNEDSWLDRFAALDYDALLDKAEEDRPDLTSTLKRVQYLDNLYEDTGRALGTEVEILKGKLEEYEAMDLHIDTATEEEVNKAFTASADNMDALAEFEQWMNIGIIYEGLKAYEGGRFEKGELLDFFLEDAESDDEERYYPMAAALTEGQLHGLPFVSFETLLRYAFTDEEGWKEQAKDAACLSKPQDVSVYENIDRSLFMEDGTVAMTDAAKRAEATGSLGLTGDETGRELTFSRIAQIGLVASAAGIAATVVSKMFSGLMNKLVIKDLGTMTRTKFAISEIVSDSAKLKTFKAMCTEKGWSDVNFLVSGARYAYILTKVLMITALAVSIVTAVLVIIDMLEDKSIKQLPIPNYLVDCRTDTDGGSFVINYKAVECNREAYFGTSYTRQKGNSADLNADEGKQWLALYVSKNSRAGNPLTPDLIVQKSCAAPGGYAGNVHIIGEKGAVNVVSQAYMNYNNFISAYQMVAGENTQYVFYKLSSDVKTYDTASGNMTASMFNAGYAALFGTGGLAVGCAAAVLISTGIRKKKEKTAA